MTDLPVTRKNVADLTERGRMRWRIENEGFNAQKKHGYYLEHLYSRNYQALKNHYYLIQIGHMIHTGRWATLGMPFSASPSNASTLSVRNPASPSPSPLHCLQIPFALTGI